MSDTSTEPTKYVAEFLDGPLEGTTEHRFLEGGKPEERVTQYALVDGTDAMFEYVAGATRELNGEQFVQYSFDPQGQRPPAGPGGPGRRVQEPEPSSEPARTGSCRRMRSAAAGCYAQPSSCRRSSSMP